MKKSVKCIVSSMLVASMTMSMASCSLFDKAGKLCTEVGDEFMQAALERELEDMAELCSDEDDAMDIFDSYTGDNDPVQALLDRASFSAGKPSCSTKDKKGEITYTVTIPDYEAALDEEPEDVDELADLLDEVKDTIDIEVTLEFKLKKDDWLIDNPEDIAEDLYGELFDINFGFESYLTSHIDHAYFYGATDNEYTNVTTLDYDIYFDNSDDFEYYFEVYKDGSLIYTSDIDEDWSYVYCYCRYYETTIYDSATEYFPQGNYTYNVYDSDGALIISETCTVVNTYD